MAAIKQVLLGVVITTALLGEENTITRVVKAQPIPRCYLSKHPCTNYINLTEFSKLCYLYKNYMLRNGFLWYKCNYTSYTNDEYRREPCPFEPCHPCRNDSDVKLKGVLNITYCDPFYIYQLPEFRCVLRHFFYGEVYWNNTGPLYKNCSKSTKGM